MFHVEHLYEARIVLKTYYGTALKEIELSDSITTISNGGFRNCSSLTEVVVPKSCTAINSSSVYGRCAFENCANLEKIYILNPNCKICDSGLTICNFTVNNTPYFTGTIYGYAGSTAEGYANKYGYDFIALDADKTPGNANGDNAVSVADVLLIRQYLAKWNVTIDKSSADVTGDGEVTVADVLLLQQYLAKWNVILK